MYGLTPENKISERIYKTDIPGLFYLENTHHEDDRGFFKELAIIPELNTHLDREFVIKQINHARSKENVVRGMHAEDWNKLITITSGTAYCALVDIRPESKTFKHIEYVTLGEDGLSGSLFISKGIANSVCVTNSMVDYLYFVDLEYKNKDASKDREFSLFDPDLGIKWPMQREDMIISQRDLNAPTLRDLFPEKF